MSRWIDADALTADMQERYCKPCKEKGEDYNEVRCRACWVDDAIGDVDGFGDNSIDIVRCGECKKSEPSGMVALINGTLENIPSLRCKAFELERDADDFCSYGEREGE